MFGLFKKEKPIDKLNKQYKKLIEEAHRLSHQDRKASDMKTAEAEAVLEEIEKLRNEEAE